MNVFRKAIAISIIIFAILTVNLASSAIAGESLNTKATISQTFKTSASNQTKKDIALRFAGFIT